VMATLTKDGGMPGILGLAIGLLLAVGAGAVNGLLVTRINLPPFIVTLGTLSVFTAIALLYSGGESIQQEHLPGLLNALGNDFGIGKFRLTWGIVLVAVIYAVMAFVLSQTAWGRYVYAVGDDAESARLSGVPSKRILLVVYTVAGLIYGLAAWILIGRAGAATPNAAPTANLDSITAVVIGGTSLFGGRGRLIGTLIGALIVQTFDFGLSQMGVNQQWRVLATGLLVIIAVAIDQWIRRVKA
jgi:fructose transport system permease protein